MTFHSYKYWELKNHNRLIDEYKNLKLKDKIPYMQWTKERYSHERKMAEEVNKLRQFK